MGYQVKFPIGMLFKKMFCCKCGKKLQKQKISKIYSKGDIGFKRIMIHGNTVMLENKEKIDKIVYHCPNCDIITEYDEQLRISNIQKKMKKTILDENDLK